MSLVDKLIDSVGDIAAEDLRTGKRYTAAKVKDRFSILFWLQEVHRDRSKKSFAKI